MKGMFISMKKIVIIGGGIAGLSAGIFAQMNGFSSEIYEKNDIAGGQCIGWDRKGHHIDNCIHWLTGTKKGTDLYQLWQTLGAIDDNIKMVELNQFYTTEYGGKRATLWRDLDRTQRELIKLAPEDEMEIRKFISATKSSECCEVPIKKPSYMLGIGDYMELGKKMSGMMPVIKEYGKINIKDFADRFKSPILKILFMDYMPKEYLASSFIVSYGIMASGNGNIPEKGSLAMTNRIIDKYKKLGGKLYTSRPVKKVNINDGKAESITLTDDTVVKADYVVSSTDTWEAFNNLLGEQYIDKSLAKCYASREDFPLFSGLQTAYSVNKGVINEDVTVFDCKPFKVGNKTINRMSVKSYHYEDSFAPAGKMVLQSNVLQLEDDFEYWKSLSKEDYSKAKKEIANQIMERVIEKFPQLKDSIEILDCWTPLTYTKYCNSFHGAYMSFITKKDIKQPTLKASIKGLSNVFIASQWLISPGGLPTAAATGKFAIQHILKKERKSIEI